MPAQQTIVRKADVDDIDCQRQKIIMRADNVKCPASSMSYIMHSLGKTVACDEITEPSSMRIDSTLKPDVSITGEHNRINNSTYVTSQAQ